MMHLNKVGAVLGQINGVHAMTDVTGFGLAGHGLEMARATGVELLVQGSALPTLDRSALEGYHASGCVPGGTRRNFASYGQDLILDDASEFTRDLVCDPQTSGGSTFECGSGCRERSRGGIGRRRWSSRPHWKGDGGRSRMPAGDLSRSCGALSACAQSPNSRSQQCGEVCPRARSSMRIFPTEPRLQ